MGRLGAFVSGNLFAVLIILVVGYLLGAKFPALAARVGVSA